MPVVLCQQTRTQTGMRPGKTNLVHFLVHFSFCAFALPVSLRILGLRYHNSFSRANKASEYHPCAGVMLFITCHCNTCYLSIYSHITIYTSAHIYGDMSLTRNLNIRALPQIGGVPPPCLPRFRGTISNSKVITHDQHP